MDKTNRRRSHSKSTHGCRECKRRRIKCSETHPTCAYCERFSKECQWITPASPAVALVHPLPSAPNGTVDPRESEMGPGTRADFPSASLVFGNAHFGVEDMRLLHHWTTVTYNTLDFHESPGKAILQQSAVVTYGFEHVFILRGLLSVAALHLAFLNPDDCNSFLLQASAHQNLAIKEFHAVLANMDEQTCIAAFIFSTLITIHGFAYCGLEQTSKSLNSMINTVLLVRGTSAILTPYIELVENSEFGCIMAEKRNKGATGQIPHITRLKHLVTANEKRDSPAVLGALIEGIEALQVVALESISPDIDSKHPDVATLMHWPVSLSSIFCSLLDERHPFALLTLAHFSGYLNQTGGVWWLRGYHSNIVGAIKPCLDPKHHELLLESEQGG